jgi:hypothetical protein
MQTDDQLKQEWGIILNNAVIAGTLCKPLRSLQFNGGQKHINIRVSTQLFTWLKLNLNDYTLRNDSMFLSQFGYPLCVINDKRKEEIIFKCQHDFIGATTNKEVCVKCGHAENVL